MLKLDANVWFPYLKNLSETKISIEMILSDQMIYIGTYVLTPPQQGFYVNKKHNHEGRGK